MRYIYLQNRHAHNSLDLDSVENGKRSVLTLFSCPLVWLCAGYRMNLVFFFKNFCSFLWIFVLFALFPGEIDWGYWPVRCIQGKGAQWGRDGLGVAWANYNMNESMFIIIRKWGTECFNTRFPLPTLAKHILKQRKTKKHIFYNL